MRTLSLITLLMFSVVSSFSQEICDNGIDDDGNGLIDLQDSACTCLWKINDTITSFIPNHSFEDTLCCPYTVSQLHCTSNWQACSFGTVDYFNTCGYQFIPSTGTWPTKPPPIPIQDGEGYAGFASYSTGEDPFNGSAEYMGICLTDTLFTNKKYKMRFYLAFSTGSINSSIDFFGTTSCSNIPFFSTDFCGPSGTNWYHIENILTTLDSTKWNEILVSFTPTTDLTAIVIGTSCNIDSGGNYYYIDNLLLNECSKFSPLVEISENGSICTNSFFLSVSSDSIPNSIQWYKDEIALVGETTSTLNITGFSTNTYQVRLYFDSGCITKSFQHSINEKYELVMPNVFTPNNDNSNDIFKPIKFECIIDVTLSIYNRWGQQVYETSELPISWDGRTNGKDCSEGVYYWTLSINEGKRKESGTVSLFR